MPEFWIDSNIYIRSKDGILALDIAPRFWGHLVRLADAGRTSSPIQVYGELLRHSSDGDLFDVWVKRFRNSLFTEPTAAALGQMELIIEYVMGRYTEFQATKFLGEADPWLIAHAVASGARIVTNEISSTEPRPNQITGLIDTKVRIPNVGRHFGIATVSLPTMLRALGVNDL